MNPNKQGATQNDIGRKKSRTPQVRPSCEKGKVQPREGGRRSSTANTSGQRKSFKDALPSGYWGVNGKPIWECLAQEPDGEASLPLWSASKGLSMSEKKTVKREGSVGDVLVMEHALGAAGPSRATKAACPSTNRGFHPRPSVDRGQPRPSRKTTSPAEKTFDRPVPAAGRLFVDAKKPNPSIQDAADYWELQNDTVRLSERRKTSSAVKRNEASHRAKDKSVESYADANKYLYSIFKDRVQLKKFDIQENKTIPYRLKILLGEIKKLDPKFPLLTTDKSICCTGSYYEKLKVGRPNEFDVMVSLDIKPTTVNLEYEREKHMEGYVKIRALQDVDMLARYMTDDRRYLSPVKIRQHFLQLLKLVTRSQGNVSAVEHGPAVQLTFTEGRNIVAEVDVVLAIAFSADWPKRATVEKHGLRPQMLEELKSKGFHLVPKPFENGKTSARTAVHWRVSYSLAEKKLLLKHVKIEKKNVLKFVKFLRETYEKQLPGLNSFHLKNIFLQQAVAGKKSLSWDKDSFLERVTDFLGALLEALSQGNVRHFFNSQCNLLVRVSKADKKKCISTVTWLLEELQSNDKDRISSLF